MRPFLPLLFSLLFLAACGPDPSPDIDEAAQLEGRWVIEEAQRDQVKTGNLDGLYFDFGADGTFRTNLPPGEQEGQWVREADEIVTSGVAPPNEFTIEYLDAEELNLKAEFQGAYFEMALVRQGAAGQ